MQRFNTSTNHDSEARVSKVFARRTSTLIAHPAFRLADKKPRPFFWQANRHGGICAGPVTVYFFFRSCMTPSAMCVKSEDRPSPPEYEAKLKAEKKQKARESVPQF
jgi:hypothetical protein